MSEGNKNPPKRTQSKKGPSGNPGGRQRGIASFGRLDIRKVARVQISIEVDGVPTKMPRWEALMRQIYTMALGKDPSATRLLRQIRKYFPGTCRPATLLPLILLKPMRGSSSIGARAMVVGLTEAMITSVSITKPVPRVTVASRHAV
jgi:hypothetical protein